MSFFAALTTSDACTHARTHAHTSEQTAAAAVQYSLRIGGSERPRLRLYCGRRLVRMHAHLRLPQSRPSSRTARLKVAMNGRETRPIDRTTAAQRIMWPMWYTLIVSRPKHRLTCGGPARLNLMPAFCSMMRSMPVSRTDANVTHTPSLPARPARCAAGCTLWSPSFRPPPAGRFATAFHFVRAVLCVPHSAGQSALSAPRTRPLQGTRWGRSIDVTRRVVSTARLIGAFASAVTLAALRLY
jgi:hypothetical protein